MHVDEIPVAHTPPGGYGDHMPPPILHGCDDPLVDGAPDLRGTWQIVGMERPGGPLEPEPMLGHLQRIEQAGDRVCITSAGIVHDMRADGTVENGVHDVTAVGGDEITVVCSYEHSRHVLRPVGLPGVEVTRHLEGDTMVWVYGPLFTARLERVNP